LRFALCAFGGARRSIVTFLIGGSLHESITSRTSIGHLVAAGRIYGPRVISDSGDADESPSVPKIDE
jgi:hypothetical protein